MTTITRHVVTEKDREALQNDIFRFYVRTSTKQELQDAVTVPTGVWPVAAFLEEYDTLLVQGRILEYREVQP